MQDSCFSLLKFSVPRSSWGHERMRLYLSIPSWVQCRWGQSNVPCCALSKLFNPTLKESPLHSEVTMETPNLLKTWAFTLVQAFDYKKFCVLLRMYTSVLEVKLWTLDLLQVQPIANSRIRTQTLDLFFMKCIMVLFWARRVMGQTNSS